MACANAAWCAHHALWGCLDVSQTRRVVTFKSLVYTRLTNGLEALCLSKSELRKLEASVMKKLRRILCGSGRGRTNSSIRAECDVPTVTSFLRCRRLKLFVSILRMIGNLASADSGLPAALLSPGSDFSLPQLAGDGSVSAEANPWLRQFCEDVAEARRCGNVEELPVDILQWRDNASLMYSRFRKLLSH